MPLNRLELTRYGKFTDGVLDFGDKPHLSPDLHVVYGPNEAGKSTSLDAILDLIFGIGTTSRYGFLHPYPTMRIGANITVAGNDREFLRIKRPQNSLLDSEDHRNSLDAASADAFEAAMKTDDHLTSRRLLYFAEVGKLHQLGHRRAAVGAEIDTCRNRLQQASFPTAAEVRELTPAMNAACTWE
ncbi:uncharacterized protein YhaN [Rhizobium sp. BK538]|nr:uncharacterized protein YhaN [Rhizobium sp. BK538]